MSQKLTQLVVKRYQNKIDKKPIISEVVEKHTELKDVENKQDKFKFSLTEDGEIQLEIEGKKHNISKNCAMAMKYELYQVVGRKNQYDDTNKWKPEIY